jgi:hypothetical protein
LIEMNGEKVNSVTRYPRICTVDAFTLLIDFNPAPFPVSEPFGARIRAFAPKRHFARLGIAGNERSSAGDEIRGDGRRGDGSGATQPEEFFEESSRDDKPEPPIGHPPRFHRFDPWLAGAASLGRGIAASPVTRI